MFLPLRPPPFPRGSYAATASTTFKLKILTIQDRVRLSRMNQPSSRVLRRAAFP